MRISEIVEILGAKVICCEDPGLEIFHACASDLMSDVLAFAEEPGVLLTGLLNTQAVRTAEMLDVKCVVFVRGKSPGQDVIDLAKERGIALLSSGERMFSACGKLYSKGLGRGSDD